MIDLDLEVEVIPPATERAFTPRDEGVRRRHGQAGYSYGVGGSSGNIIANVYAWVLGVYHQTAEDAITKYLGPDPDAYSIEVDGVPNAPISDAKLTGSGIIAAPFGNVDDLKKAFNAAWKYITAASSRFKRPTGAYMGAMTIRVNGIEVDMINWDNVTSRSNIQIFSKVRHASPIESIKRGTLLLGARNAAKRAGGSGVRASFTYRSPTKFGQYTVVSKSGRGATPKGSQFTPLAVPVLEIGAFGSNVTDYIGNIEYNLERGRKRSSKNMIERNILKDKRWLSKRPRNVPRAR